MSVAIAKEYFCTHSIRRMDNVRLAGHMQFVQPFNADFEHFPSLLKRNFESNLSLKST